MIPTDLPEFCRPSLIFLLAYYPLITRIPQYLGIDARLILFLFLNICPTVYIPSCTPFLFSKN